MIFPFFSGWTGFKNAPVTWFLVILNTLICIWTNRFQHDTQSALGEFYDQDALVRTQGEIFAEYISRHTVDYDPLFVALSDKAMQGSYEHKSILGRLALRDKSFVKASMDLKTDGDEVALDYWKEKYLTVRSVLDRDPVNTWGLGMNDNSAVKWITYQFLHGGYGHLVSNMLFLIIFGCLLEPLMGSAVFILAYLVSGFFAAGVYIEMSGISGVPLVGASGAISGLMGIIVGLYQNTKLKYFYWILPIRGYNGFIMLPAWVLLLIWGVSDVAGFLSTIRELGGVAHAAHIGGALHGLLIGILLRLTRRISTEISSGPAISA